MMQDMRKHLVGPIDGEMSPQRVVARTAWENWKSSAKRLNRPNVWIMTLLVMSLLCNLIVMVKLNIWISPISYWRGDDDSATSLNAANSLPDRLSGVEALVSIHVHRQGHIRTQEEEEDVEEQEQQHEEEDETLEENLAESINSVERETDNNDDEESSLGDDSDNDGEVSDQLEESEETFINFDNETEEVEDLTTSRKCDNPILAMQGEFRNHQFSFTGPCSTGPLKQRSRWIQNRREACAILSKYEIYLIGQSTERRLYYALQELAAGNPWSFKNGIPEEDAQHLFDRKGKLTWVTKNRDLLDCFHVHLRFETSFAGIAAAIKEFTKPKKRQHNRKVVVVFQSGLYALAANDFKLSDLTRQLSTFFRSTRVAERAKQNDIMLMWRPPVPVNNTHKRFRLYSKAGGPNRALNLWRQKSNNVVRSHGACIFDTFQPLLDGIDKGTIRFENGTEWNPPQFGGIHFKDNGRKLVAQLFLNALKYCDTRKY